ncbi:MAG: peptide chain release factor N(5)-glutamine methyltransferase [bacterium]|nr:peptide chain release factor N(5)-glutamine methyltransferase [bacterium]
MDRDERWLLDEKYGGIKTPEYEIDEKRLATGEPLGYVIGWQPFLGLKIFLDSHPLIPRPETEWWVEQLLQNSPATSTVLDLCAGSGAIGCAALEKLPSAPVYFGEIDPTHETTIQKNIQANNLDATRAEVRIGDLFTPFGDMKFDIIAANPPYIPSGRTLEPSVTDYEPALALFSGDDGLDLMRRIAVELPKHLTKSGRAWVECDRAHAPAARELFVAQDLSAEIRTDQYSVPRVIVVSFP